MAVDCASTSNGGFRCAVVAKWRSILNTDSGKETGIARANVSLVCKLIYAAQSTSVGGS